MSNERASNAEGELFSATHWTTVFTAGSETSTNAKGALERLCASYWYPLYAYVRRRGHSPSDAQDLTQEFFARFLERKYVRLACPSRGRFRTFLLTSVQHFLVNEWKKENRIKRGGGVQIVSLDDQVAEEKFCAEPFTDKPPDSLYDKGWASTLLEQALARLRAEFDAAEKAESFEKLKAFVWGGREVDSYAVEAEKLGMSEGALKVAVHRIRQRFGELLRAEVARTVSTPAEIEEELRYLISVVRG